MASLDGEEDREFVIQRWRKEIPTADVREVVTCGECKWWRGEGTICKGIGIDFDADGFCCEGERKESTDMRPEPPKEE